MNICRIVPDEHLTASSNTCYLRFTKCFMSRYSDRPGSQANPTPTSKTLFPVVLTPSVHMLAICHYEQSSFTMTI